jgi:hypothetical protein
MEQSSGREKNGRFRKGHHTSPGTEWKAGQSGNTGGMSFSVHCQYLMEKYELVEEVAQIAGGIGKYRNVAISDRLHAFEILADRGFGKPKQSVDLDGGVSDVPRVQFVKRIVVDDPERFEKAI